MALGLQLTHAAMTSVRAIAVGSGQVPLISDVRRSQERAQRCQQPSLSFKCRCSGLQLLEVVVRVFGVDDVSRRTGGICVQVTDGSTDVDGSPACVDRLTPFSNTRASSEARPEVSLVPKQVLRLPQWCPA